MNSRQTDRLLELEKAVSDQTKSVSDVLRLCLMLADETDASQLRSWARKELNGYSKATDELPDYRTIPAQLQTEVRQPSGYVTNDLPLDRFEMPNELRATLKDELVLIEGEPPDVSVQLAEG